MGGQFSDGLGLGVAANRAGVGLNTRILASRREGDNAVTVGVGGQFGNGGTKK